MNVILNLANEYQWKIQLKFPQDTDLSTNFQIYLDLAPTNSLLEHEQLLTPPSDADFDILIQSILNDGFLHPILVTHNSPQNFWVIADGTHRKMAMTKLRSKWTPCMILQENTFSREAWIKTFHSNTPSLENFFNKLSSDEKKNIYTEEITLESIIYSDLPADILGIIRKEKKITILKSKSPKNRLKHLKLIKMLDGILDEPDKEYIRISELKNIKNDFLFLPPPLDSENDMEYLVKDPTLQRPKGSRTIIPLRLIYLPIPFEILQYSYQDSLTAIKELIDQLFKKKDIGGAFLNKEVFNFLDDSWYEHCLLIGSKNSFFHHIPEHEQINFKNLIT